jgi:hypothetical protein
VSDRKYCQILKIEYLNTSDKIFTSLRTREKSKNIYKILIFPSEHLQLLEQLTLNEKTLTWQCSNAYGASEPSEGGSWPVNLQNNELIEKNKIKKNEQPAL